MVPVLQTMTTGYLFKVVHRLHKPGNPYLPDSLGHHLGLNKAFFTGVAFYLADCRSRSSVAALPAVRGHTGAFQGQFFVTFPGTTYEQTLDSAQD